MLGKEMKLYRENNNLTLKVVSEKSGLSPVYLSQIEREIRTPLVKETLKKISKSYGIVYPRIVECVLEDIRKKLEDDPERR